MLHRERAVSWFYSNLGTVTGDNDACAGDPLSFPDEHDALPDISHALSAEHDALTAEHDAHTYVLARLFAKI